MPDHGKWMFLLGCSLVAFAPRVMAGKPYLAVVGPPPIRFSKAPEIPVEEPDVIGEESDVSDIDGVSSDDVSGRMEGKGLPLKGAMVGDAGDTGYTNIVTGGPRTWIQKTQPVSLEGMTEYDDPSSAGSPIIAEQQRVEEEIQDIFVPERGTTVPRVYVPLTPQMFVPPNSVTSPGSSAAYRVVPR